MRKVDLQLSAMACPAYCCKCGETPTDVKTYSERIALRAVAPLKVSVNVPVCKSCANRKLFLYISAFAVLGISLVGFKLAASGHVFGRYLSALFLAAAVLYALAVRSTPIKILDYRPNTDTITLGCMNKGFASELASMSRGMDAEYVRVRRVFWVIALLVLVAAIVAMSFGF
jgi:hypothetical protein